MDRQAVSEKRSWDSGAEDGGQIGHEVPEGIEYGHHLRSVTVAMSGDRSTKSGQGEVSFRLAAGVIRF